MKRLMSALTTAVLLGASFAQVTPEEVDAALEASALGPHQPQEEDWNEIERLAREEGEVVLYSLSSRHPAVAEVFTERYGIDVVYAALNTDEQLQRLDAQQRANRPEVDIMFIGEAPQVFELLESGRLVGYIPRSMEDVIPPDMRIPAIKHGTEAFTVLYNNETYPEPPVSSWWDLTRPEWRGLVSSGELTGAVYLSFFASLIQNADELEAEYERVFGEPIEYTQPYENAGYEFTKRLLDNQPRTLQSPAELIDAMAMPGNDGLVLLGTAQTRRAENLLRVDDAGNLDLPLSTELTPRWAMLFSHTLVIPAGAPNPNAAKLLWRFLLEEEGYAPWSAPGTFPPRTDWESPPFTPALDLDRVWMSDVTFLETIQGELLDFFLIYR